MLPKIQKVAVKIRPDSASNIPIIFLFINELNPPLVQPLSDNCSGEKATYLHSSSNVDVVTPSLIQLVINY